MVDNAAATIKAIVAHGGEIVQPIGDDALKSRQGSAIPEET